MVAWAKIGSSRREKEQNSIPRARARARAAAAAAAAATDALSADLPMSNSATYSNSGEEVCRRACLRARARACVRVRVCVCARAGVCVRG